MMKKWSKVALLAAATAFLLAGVTACFTSDDDDDDEPVGKSVDYELADMGLPDGVSVTKIESADSDIVDIETKGEGNRAATAADGKSITSVTVMPKKEGSTYFIITTTAEIETWYLPVIVTKDLTVEIDPDDLTKEDPDDLTEEDPDDLTEKDPAAGTYTLDITAIPETTGTTTKVDGTVTVVSTIKNSSGKDQTIKYSSNGYVQMSGAKAQAGYGLQLTLPKAAVITATATEKAADKSGTKLFLLDASDASQKAETTDTIDAFGTAAASLKELTLEADAGTYLFGANANGCFVYSLKIEYK